MKNEIYNLRFGLPPKTEMKFYKNLAEAYKMGYQKLSNRNFTDKITSSSENMFFEDAENMMNETKTVLAEWLNKQTNYKFNYKKENLLLVDGCSEAIILLMRIIFPQNSKVLIEAPSYHKYIKYFENEGYELIPINRSENDGNFNLEEIENILKRQKIDLFYFVPTCSNPPGKNIELYQKQELVKFARKYDFYLLADDIYEYLTPDIIHIPTAFSNNQNDLKDFVEDKIISINSFNKLFNVNGTRFGWIHAKQDLIDNISYNRRKINTDLMPTNLDIFRYFSFQFYIKNTIDDLFKYTINSLTYKRNEVVKIIKLSNYCDFEIPKAGYFLWIKLSQKISIENLKNILEKKNIWVQFGENFVGKSFTEKFDSLKFLKYRVRISIGTLPIDKLMEGVNLLLNSINDSVKENTKF